MPARPPERSPLKTVDESSFQIFDEGRDDAPRRTRRTFAEVDDENKRLDDENKRLAATVAKLRLEAAAVETDLETERQDKRRRASLVDERNTSLDLRRLLRESNSDCDMDDVEETHDGCGLGDVDINGFF